jgi:hypothetical protein
VPLLVAERGEEVSIEIGDKIKHKGATYEVVDFDHDVVHMRKLPECEHKNTSDSVKLNTYPYGENRVHTTCTDCGKYLGSKELRVK